MQVGQGWLFWWLRGSVLIAGLVAGCASTKPTVENRLMADKGANTRHTGVVENYVLACPDVVEVFIGREPGVLAVIDTDGRVDLGNLGKPRLEGLSPPQAARQLATQLRLPRDQVRLRVAAFKSQHLLLF